MTESDLQSLRRALDARRPFRELDFKCPGADGAARWFSINGMPRFDAGGEFVGYHGIAVDITRLHSGARAAADALADTERLTMQEALRASEFSFQESEARLQHVLDAIPVAVARWDRAQRYLYANRKFAGDRGAEAEEIVGRTIREVIGEDAYALQAPLLARVAAGESVRYERRMVRPSGDVRHFDVIAFPDRTGRTGTTGGYVVALDVTLQRNAQLGLAASEQSLRSLLSHLPGFAYRCANEREGKPEFVSAGIEALTGHPAGEFGGRRGRSFSDFIHPQDKRRIWEATQTALAHREPYELEYRINTRTGEEKWVWDRGQGIFTADDECLLLEGLISDITARKQTEKSLEALNFELERRVARRTEALAQSEAHLRAVVDEAPVGIGIVSARGQLLEANERMCEILGHAKADLIGRDYRHITHPDDLSANDSARKEMVAGRRDRYSLQKRYLRKDGSVVWVDLSVAAVRDAQGALRHSIAVVEDISERRRQEQALRERETQLRMVTENIPAIVVQYDSDGICRYANTRYAQAVGRPVEEMIGLSFEQIVGPQRAAEEDERKRMVQSGHSVRFERSSHDGVGTSEVTLVPYFAPDGIQNGYFAFAVDISEHKRQQRGLRESEERLRHVIDLVPSFVFAKDAQGRFLFSNLAYATFYDKSPEELIGRSAEQIGICAQDAAASDAIDATIRLEGTRIEMPQQRLRGVDGAERLFWEVRMPMRYSADAPDAVLCVAIDITDLKAAQAEVENLNVELEARVAARTDQLAAANREMESFSYSISHDLRAPVRAMSGFAGILIEDHGAQLTSDARALVDRIAAAGARMGAMIDALLELARVSRSAPRMQTVDLAAMAREVWSEVVVDEPHRSVAFSAPAACNCECDPVLVRNLLQNLLGNAFKYTRRTPIARVEFGLFDSGVEKIYFVRDNGAGFDMAYVDKLFGTFQRLHGANEFEGTGVGLATAQRVVARHGGRIWAEASPGEGASFQFTLRPPQGA